jgi:hypothetical protein
VLLILVLLEFSPGNKLFPGGFKFLPSSLIQGLYRFNGQLLELGRRSF